MQPAAWLLLRDAGGGSEACARSRRRRRGHDEKMKLVVVVLFAERASVSDSKSTSSREFVVFALVLSSVPAGRAHEEAGPTRPPGPPRTAASRRLLITTDHWRLTRRQIIRFRHFGSRGDEPAFSPASWLWRPRRTAWPAHCGANIKRTGYTPQRRTDAAGGSTRTPRCELYRTATTPADPAPPRIPHCDMQVYNTRTGPQGSRPGKHGTETFSSRNPERQRTGAGGLCCVLCAGEIWEEEGRSGWSMVCSGWFQHQLQLHGSQRYPAVALFSSTPNCMCRPESLNFLVTRASIQ